MNTSVKSAKSHTLYPYSGGISRGNRQHLELLHREFRAPFGAEEAADCLGVPRERASRLLRHLASQGWLARVKHGLYVAVPLEARSSGQWIEDPWVAGSKAFAPCYIAGWSACEHWGLTDQIFSEIAVVTAKPIRKKRQTIQRTTFVVKQLAPNQIFGTKALWRRESRVEVSDPSRTVIDMLDDPRLGGGIRHVAAALDEYWASYLDEQRLLGYAARRNNRSVYKRLGYLLEVQNIGSPGLIEACRSSMSTGLAALDPSVSEPGRIVKRWNLRVNVGVVGDSAMRHGERSARERDVKTGLARLLDEKRDAILAVAARNGAKHVRVFGSVARGEERDDSDVDFLVELDDDRSLLDHSRLILDLEELLGRKVHVLTPGSLHSVIRDEVLAEARPL